MSAKSRFEGVKTSRLRSKRVNFKDQSFCHKNSKCKNVIGSYSCICNSGYEMGIGYMPECIDVDECKRLTNSCNKNQHCINTDGSFSCLCNDGYRPMNDSILVPDTEFQCEDINECEVCLLSIKHRSRSGSLYNI